MEKLICTEQPKLELTHIAELMQISIQAVHKQLKAKGIKCYKHKNKSYITHDEAKQLLDIHFEKTKISVQIVKGGTGKTTTTDNLLCGINRLGGRGLAIDADPQGNLTDRMLNLLMKLKNMSVEDLPVLIDVISGDATIEESIVEVYEGLDIIPSRIENVVLDNKISNDRLPLHTLFSELLAPIEDKYDFIIIDCPPTMGQTVTAANLYADTILAPLNPDKFSAKGLTILKKELALLRKHYKKDINFKVFLNKFSGNTILSDKTLTNLLADEDMNGRILETAVRFSQDIPNTTDSGKNLFSSLKKSTARDDFDQLTRELLGINKFFQRKVA